MTHVPGLHGAGNGLIATAAGLHKMCCLGLQTQAAAGMTAGVNLATGRCSLNDRKEHFEVI